MSERLAQRTMTSFGACASTALQPCISIMYNNGISHISPIRGTSRRLLQTRLRELSALCRGFVPWRCEMCTISQRAQTT